MAGAAVAAPVIKLKGQIMRERKIQIVMVAITLVSLAPVAQAWPYKQPGVNGYVGPNGGPARPDDPNAIINPIFRSWADGVANYEPAAPEYIDPWWQDPNMALGPATANDLVVSLGDLDQSQIDNNDPPGQITLSFSETIRDAKGYDFAVFENGFFYPHPPSIYGLGIGEMFAELAYVEVSSDGINFVRFPAVSLNPGPVGSFGYIETGNIYNLAGKHPNNWDWFMSPLWIWCTGTPFDLSEIADDPNVVSGVVDINNINYVRIVDIPGSGNFYDDANHPIYDAWPTWGSGGFDLDAIGVLEGQEYSADINLDGIVNTNDLLLFTLAWLSEFGDDNFNPKCDLAVPQDYIINMLDYAVFANQWLKVEQWRSQ